MGKSKLLKVVYVAAMLSIGATGEQSSTITISGTVEVKSTYTLTIPADTTVAEFGYTKLGSNVKVTGELVNDDKLEVVISSKNESNFVKTDNSTVKIPYTLVAENTQENPTAIQSLIFSSSDLNDTGKDLWVYVNRNHWNTVPGGNYSDVLTFKASLVQE